MKALARFKKGARVKISCYHLRINCRNISLSVILGEELKIHPAFIRLGRIGRLRWQPNATVKRFKLSGISNCFCPNRSTQFATVIVISNGKGKKPTIFGYEVESG